MASNKKLWLVQYLTIASHLATSSKKNWRRLYILDDFLDFINFFRLSLFWVILNRFQQKKNFEKFSVKKWIFAQKRLSAQKNESGASTGVWPGGFGASVW